MKQNALILGATKGLGLEIANHCRLHGWRTIETGRTASRLMSNERISFPSDLNNWDSVETFMGEMYRLKLDRGISIDKFFWVAGRLLKGQFAEQQEDEILETIDVNLRSALIISHLVWKSMVQTTTPKNFVVIASGSGTSARQGEAIYVATKHAQVGFTRSLGLENNNENLRTTLVLPGGMRTSFWNKNYNPEYEFFLDPRKVAALIVARVAQQKNPFIEFEVPRGSL